MLECDLRNVVIVSPEAMRVEKCPLYLLENSGRDCDVALILLREDPRWLNGIVPTFPKISSSGASGDLFTMGYG